MSTEHIFTASSTGMQFDPGLPQRVSVLEKLAFFFTYTQTASRQSPVHSSYTLFKHRKQIVLEIFATTN